MKQSVLEVSDRNIYDLDTVGSERKLTKHGPNDARMGVSARHGAFCQTCGGSLNECNGHFGRVRLALPAFHVGYFRNIVEILQDICKVPVSKTDPIYAILTLLELFTNLATRRCPQNLFTPTTAAGLG